MLDAGVAKMRVAMALIIICDDNYVSCLPLFYFNGRVTLLNFHFLSPIYRFIINQSKCGDKDKEILLTYIDILRTDISWRNGEMVIIFIQSKY